MTWNVRGCNNIKNRRNIKAHITKQNVNFLCLQETKCSSWDLSMRNSLWDRNTHGWIEVPATGLSGGLLITWDMKQYNHISHSTGNNWIALKSCTTITHIAFIIINVYAPQTTAQKTLLWEQLSAILHSNIDTPVCLMGDFNSVITAEVRANCLHSILDTNTFISFINKNNLTYIKT